MDDDIYTKRPENRAALLTIVRNAHDRLEATLARLDHEQMTSHGLEGERSPADIMAHVTAWEELLLRWFRGGDAPELTAGFGPDPTPVEEFNRRTHEENSGRPLQDIRLAFNTKFEEVVAELTAIDEERLLGQEESTPERPAVWHAVGANTYWHYREHAEELERWINEPGPAGGAQP